MQNNIPMAWLIGAEGTPSEFQYQITNSETTLGRGVDCDFQVDDPLTSRRHAVIHLRAGGFEIEDLNSGNGTFVNGKQVTTGPISDGDQIKIGDTLLRIRMKQDLDATIIQMRPAQETVITSRETILLSEAVVKCQDCGETNPEGKKYCFECGAALPRLLESFQNSLDSFRENQRSYQSGQLSTEDYRAALAKLVVQDQNGKYWMLGVESGEWHFYDGERWTRGNPPQMLPGDEEPPQSTSSVNLKPVGEAGSPQDQTTRSRWGVIGLWLISALIVLGFGVYTVIELISFSRFRQEAQLAPLSPEEELNISDSTDSLQDSDLSSTAGEESDFPAESVSGYRLRPYNPAGDESLQSLTLEAVFQEDQSTEELSIYEKAFPADTSGLLVMGWCAIDQATLENNMAIITMEGTFDGTVIPQNMWTVENSQEEGMFCRSYRTVVGDLELGSHRYLRSTSYDNPVFDGWETYPPGTYLNEYIIDVKEPYTFIDEFESSEGHWGEASLDEVQVWIEGGNLHFELYQESVGAWSSFQDREFEDFMLIAHARSVSNNPGYYGIVFRQQDADNYYFFEIIDEGTFRFGKRVGGDIVDLIPWTPSEAIVGDGGENRLAVSMEGDGILALINGELVVDLHDDSLSSGNLGLLAGTPDGVESFHAVFDRVSIDALE